jgi:chaperonin GroES
MAKIFPANDFLLVKPEVDTKSKGGILLVQSDKAQRPDKGVILAVGPGKYVDGKLEEMRLKVGQRILFQQFPAFDFEDEGHKIQFIRELQVVAVLE